MSLEGRTRTPIDVRLLVAIYALEAGAISLVMGLHKYSDRLTHLGARSGAWLLGALAVFMVAVGYVARSYRRYRDSGTRPFYFALATNLVVVVIVLSAGEVTVRSFSVPGPLGLSFAGTLLLPKSWEETKTRNRGLLEGAPSNGAYFVGDTLLGWTVGPNRRSKDGMYLSSVEGIRSPRLGMVYAGSRASNRVAAIGDSFTFGLDGPFEDSWGSQLERALGESAVVLNFGVDGYGVDQTYLRYLRDARPWHPSVAIFGFIQHDLVRSSSVYAFLTFPEWGYPFSKPRFGLRTGKPELLNVPLISADSIVSKASVTELPFLEYEPGYAPAEWRRHTYDSSYLLRFLTSRFPRYPLTRPEVSGETIRRINADLLLQFTRVAAAEGTIPLVAYYPSRNDLRGGDLSAKDSVLAKLRGSGVEYLDLTSCVKGIGVEKVFIPGKPHYSAAGNAAVARCLLPFVKRGLDRRPAN